MSQALHITANKLWTRGFHLAPGLYYIKVPRPPHVSWKLDGNDIKTAHARAILCYAALEWFHSASVWPFCTATEHADVLSAHPSLTLEEIERCTRWKEQ